MSITSSGTQPCALPCYFTPLSLLMAHQDNLPLSLPPGSPPGPPTCGYYSSRLYIPSKGPRTLHSWQQTGLGEAAPWGSQVGMGINYCKAKQGRGRSQVWWGDAWAGGVYRKNLSSCVFSCKDEYSQLQMMSLLIQVGREVGGINRWVLPQGSHPAFLKEENR